MIEADEGIRAAALRTAVNNRDGLQQTAVDLMQLVREIEVGMDVDGDANPDLDPSRIYYFGQSLGGMYGTIFLAVEPSIHAGVPNVPGGALIETARLSPVFRPAVTESNRERARVRDGIRNATLSFPHPDLLPEGEGTLIRKVVA